MKEVIVTKVVIDTNENGTFKSGVMQYQLKIDGVLDRKKFYTMGIGAWLDTDIVNELLAVGKEHIEAGENIT